jgi:hypothetical protein
VVTAARLRVSLRRLVFIALVVVLAAGLFVTVSTIRSRVRTTPVYDPPVLAGQLVQCTAGFYARRGEAIVLTISDHCYDRAHPPLDAAGDPIGGYGADARRSDCPTGRTCAGADIVELVLAPDHIPWGHLNLVDLGAGGYRAIAPDARPLTCGDLHEGASVETNGRGVYRSGKILIVAPYESETDTIFPCIAVTDIEAGLGDSGAAFLLDGRPAGIAARAFGNKLAFTALGEGLADLGLTLCTDPDCGIPSPAPATGRP